MTIYLRKGDNIKTAPKKAGWITSLQTILAANDHYVGDYTPWFGSVTKRALQAFQRARNLDDDGVLGGDTLGVLMGPAGWDPPDSMLRAAYEVGDIGHVAYTSMLDEPTMWRTQVFDVADPPAGYMDSAWPKPLDADHDGRNDLVYLGEKGRQELFGPIEFTASDVGKVVLDKTWVDQWIAKTTVPQLVGIESYGKRSSGTVYLHRKVIFQLLGALQEIEDAGLLSDLLTFGGSFVPRFIRGSLTTLSNHAFGVAVDFNHEWNGLGQMPALVGQKGTLRRLIGIFERWGWFWGGFYRNRKDGMHLEAVRVLPVAERREMMNGLSETAHMEEWLEAA